MQDAVGRGDTIKFTDFFDHMDKIMADIKFYNNKDEYIQLEIEGLTV